MNHADLQSSPLRGLICFNFYRGWRGISEFYRGFLPDGVSAQQTYVLELCEENCGVVVSDIAAMLEIDPPAVSSLLGRMEKSGLIRRVVMQTNRRHTQVFLTKAGSKMRDRIRAAMAKADAKLEAFVSQKDIERLVMLVDKIRTVVDGS